MEIRRPYDQYEDRRKYPRVILGCPVEIHFKGVDLKAIAYDLSPDGLQIRCERKTLQAIRPSGRFIKKGNEPILDVEFSLQIGKNRKKIKVTGKMYYFVLLPDEEDAEVALGLYFTQFYGRSGRYVDDFIVDALTPIETKILAFLDEPRSNSEILNHMKMESQEVSSRLIQLVEDGQVISIGTGNRRRYLRLVTAMSSLFEKFTKMEKRIEKLEQAAKK